MMGKMGLGKVNKKKEMRGKDGVYISFEILNF